MSNRSPHYVGIAALITAISTAVLGFWQFYEKTKYNENMMRSMFSMINYRLVKIERELNIESPIFLDERSMVPLTLSAVAADESNKSECASDTDCRSGYSCVNSKCGPTKKLFNFDTIQSLVTQTGKALNAPAD